MPTWRLRHRRLPFILAGLLALSSLPGCQRNPGQNLVLVTVDTLRADHLSFYGYERETTPRLDEWVGEAAIFESCYTPLPLTDPSMASIMTGHYPMRHGVRHVGRTLAPEFRTLAQFLESEGYTTAAFVSRNALVDGGDLARGFQVADFSGGFDPSLPKAQAAAERWQRRAKDVTAAALEWLDAGPDAPFFLWLHYFDPHAFYDPREPYRDHFAAHAQPQPVYSLGAWWGRPRDIGQTVAHYDEEILTVDAFLANVVDAMKARGIWDSTLFVLTSDHGESLGEHGHMDHGEWLYQEQIRVPLLMRQPGRIPAAMRVPDLVRVIDLPATIVELLGVAGPDTEEFVSGMDGESFASLFDGGEIRKRRIFLESENCPPIRRHRLFAPGMYCYPPGIAGKIRGVFDGRWKLIVTPRRGGRVRELYDLDNDPRESQDLSEVEIDRVVALEADIDSFWQNQGKPAAKLAPEVMERLRILGYAE